MPPEHDADADKTTFRSGISNDAGAVILPGDTAWVDPDPGTAAPAGGSMIGHLLGGRYLLERKLGEGGMGVVYLASDQEVKGESFAVKVLKPEIRAHPEALALLREEVRTTRALRHANIVGVYSLNSDRRDVYILMEYLEGKPLDALLDEQFGRGMTFSRAWPLIQDICEALACAHDHNVIHSDLKPSNVFLTTSGQAKLLDFGIARVARTRAGRFDPSSVGALTVAYASCEMLDGCKPDQSDDVYSLACVIYEMLTGKHPFGSRSAREAREAGAVVAPIASLSQRQNAALAEALAFDRARRIPSVEALLAGLRDAAPASTSSPPAPAAATARRSGIWIGMAAAVCLLAVIGIVWVIFIRDRPEPPSPGPPATPAGAAGTTPSQVQALAAKARALEVDPEDGSFKQGIAQLAAAQAALASGAEAEGRRLLSGAAEALERAVTQGKRLARLGSGPDEIAQAVALCQRYGTKCSPSDFADEAPRTVSLAPFALDIAEVTNREFAEFVAANRYVTGAEHDGGLFATRGAVGVFRPGESWKTLQASLRAGVESSDYPVRGIDFNSAKDYCRWRNKRLPTESEWEFAARGKDHPIFAWGNEPRPPGSASALPANKQPATGRFGNRGLGDGLLEWVDGGTTGDQVLRGASWLDTNPVNQRLAMRRLMGPSQALLDTGFRCAQSVETWPDEVPGGTR